MNINKIIAIGVLMMLIGSIIIFSIMRAETKDLARHAFADGWYSRAQSGPNPNFTKDSLEFEKMLK